MRRDSMIVRADFRGAPACAPTRLTLKRLRAAIEASWDERTAHQGASRAHNPAYGQCYPTSRVVQWFFPETEIATGDVDTGPGTEAHFWNVRRIGDELDHIDLSWRQFPLGSVVTRSKVLDRTTLNDSPATIARCQLLLQRVLIHLADA